MVIDICYPIPTKEKMRFEFLRNIAKWVFLAAGYGSLIVNLCVGGKLWSLVVIWSMWFVWKFVFSPDMVEYNRISQTSKLLVYSCILLLLIEVFLSSGWAAFVIPIVYSGALFIIAVFFFTNISKQKQNIMPMLWLIVISLVSIIASFIGFPERNWPMIMLGSSAFALMVLCIIILPRDLVFEIKKRFHMK